METLRRTPAYFLSGTVPQDPEPPENAWSNAAYAAAAVPYLLAGGAEGFGAAAGLLVLAAGSWAYHRRAGLGTLLADHVGMHLAVGGVATFVLVQAGLAAPVLLAAFALASFAVLELWRGSAATTAVSRGLIKTEAAALVVGVALWSPLAFGLMAITCALAFHAHGDGANTPTGYDREHAFWHLLTALALAIPAIV